MKRVNAIERVLAWMPLTRSFTKHSNEEKKKLEGTDESKGAS